MNEPSGPLRQASSKPVGDPPARFDALRSLLEERFDELSPHLQRVARLALDQPNAVAFGTVASLADLAGVQPSSVVRFARAIGFTGFPALQTVFRGRLLDAAPERRAAARPPPAEAAAEASAILRRRVAETVASLQRVASTVESDQLEAAIELVRGAREVSVIGQRHAFAVAAHFVQGLLDAGRRSRLLDGGSGMVRDQVALMDEDDLLLAVCVGGAPKSVQEVVRQARLHGVQVLVVTDPGTGLVDAEGAAALVFGEKAAGRAAALAGLMCLGEVLAAASTAGPS